MSHFSWVRIEVDRGNGWELREVSLVDAEEEATVPQIKRDLEGYAVQYRHRALLNGCVVAEVMPGAWRKSGGATGI